MIVKTKDKIELASENFKRVHQSNFIKFAKLDDWLLKESNIIINDLLNLNPQSLVIIMNILIGINTWPKYTILFDNSALLTFWESDIKR